MYHLSRLALFLSGALVAVPAAAQLLPGEAPTQEQIQSGEVLSARPAPPAVEAVPVIAPPPMPVAKWDRRDVEELLGYVERIGEEGLDPADYQPDRLRAVLGGTDEVELNRAATDIFLRLSSDLSLGHARGDARLGWHIEDDEINGNQQYLLMAKATEDNNVGDTLTSLLPTHPQYAELKAVLAATPKSDTETIDKIRANLDRWRWMPRDLGQKYVIVNVPAYTVALVENGQVVSRHRAVVGKPKTATPQLSATISGVIFNPWWNLPQSIVKEVGAGAKGYVTTRGEDGTVYMRQRPGPNNALGRMKIVMPNDYAIYLHDTPAKNLFAKKERAFSHGCIRTQDALGFAATLLGPTGEWDEARIDETVASGKTVQADLAAPLPVYITYFTAAAAKDSGGIIAYDDLYERDHPVALALNDSDGTVLASNGN
ncbi:L,D-transpeptidase family protein [Sphingosinicella humi]|uniref:L,D-transpeptidase n=1 Tax=Allosphingosinicella humi TaxID=2068657 RepID=A0A2U2J166_9SPHN|nr:L,D-transpeptidase family protein [Sphingosinicella humi]PWG02085.1 L,D-transpeptidase [Sphingosinicella humi]